MNAKRIVLGESVQLDVEHLAVEATQNGKVEIDVEKLIVSRLLVQADSGGGKSWCMRRIFEQTHPFAQQIIIDPEGEFPSLREKFDYVLAAKQGGDVIATPRYAEAFALRLLELKVSAIIDLFELRPDERIAYVKEFLTALINAPKHLWHPVIVGVDEAHVSCPEKGFGEAESTGAVIDLCTRGRKRGYMALLGTQRISSLNKNAAAQLKNKIIGSASLDLDMKRAGDELGFDKDGRKELRRLDAGNFFCFGPAIAKTVAMVKVGKVITTHPEAGSSLSLIVPPAPARIRAVLGKLADLPAEAEATLTTIEDYKREIVELRKKVTIAEKAQPKALPAPAPVTIEVPIVDKKEFAELTKRLGELTQLTDHLAAAVTDCKGVQTSVQSLEAKIRLATSPKLPQVPARLTEHVRARAAAVVGTAIGTAQLSKLERALLTVIAQNPDGLTKGEILCRADYRSSGDTAQAFARFSAEQWTNQDGPRITLTQEGANALGAFEAKKTGAALREQICNSAKLSTCERALVARLFEAYPNEISKGTLLERAGYKSSGDTAQAFAKFVKIGWADKRGTMLIAKKALFEE